MKTKIFILFIIHYSLLIVHYSFSQMVWNQACSFAGDTTSYVAVPNSASLNITGSFTIEAWINPVNSTSPSSQTIIQKRLISSNGYTLYLSAGKVAIRTNSSTTLLGKTVLPNNQWTHIAGSFNSSTDVFRVFINGIQDTSSTVASAEPTTNNDSVLIGKGFNGPFEGKLDEVRIWNAAFISSDVLFNMRTSFGTNSGIYSTLVMSLTFQNSNPAGSLFSLNDGTGNNNNGFNRFVSNFNMSNVPSNTIAINECVDLDGTGDYLAGPDHANVSPTSGITVEAWIYPRSFNANTNIFSIIVHKGNPTGAIIDYNMSVNLRKFNFFVNEVAIFQLTTTGEFFPLNKWTHVAFTYSGTTGFMTFMINGTIRWDDTNFVGNIHDNTDSLYIGGTPAAVQCFDGLIDEVRITSSALSYGIIGGRAFTSINESNDSTSTNVVYNLDGGLVSNTDAGPRLFFKRDAGFSHNAFFNNSPVSPLTNAANFQSAYYIKNPNFRIPNTGTSGFMLSDSLDISLSEVISDVNVFVALNHTDEDNLVLSLIRPSGSAVTLYSTTSLINNSDNIVTIFDDQADSSLSSNRYIMFSPKIKPLNNLNTALSGTNTLGRWKLRIQDAAASDTGILIGWGIQFNNQTKRKSVLSLTALMQGFYNPTTNLMIPDTMRVYARNNVSPYTVFDSAKALLNNSGKADFVFNNVPDGTPVYMQLKHRNSIETWSKKPSSSTFAILFSIHFSPFTSQLEYDFTPTLSAAFGNNMIRVDLSPTEHAIYGGDVNQDGVVDGTDGAMVDNDALNFITGYVVSDANGDGITDGSDAALVVNNAFNFVSKITP